MWVFRTSKFQMKSKSSLFEAYYLELVVRLDSDKIDIIKNTKLWWPVLLSSRKNKKTVLNEVLSPSMTKKKKSPLSYFEEKLQPFSRGRKIYYLLHFLKSEHLFERRKRGRKKCHSFLSGVKKLHPSRKEKKITRFISWTKRRTRVCLLLDENWANYFVS